MNNFLCFYTLSILAFYEFLFLISGDATNLLEAAKHFISETRNAAKDVMKITDGIISVIKDAVKEATELIQAWMFASEKKGVSELDLQDADFEEAF